MDSLVGPAAFTTGIAFHLLYFKRGEHHMYGVRYIQGFILWSVTSVGFLHKVVEYDVASSISTIALLNSFFLAGLFFSLLLFRAILNPLNRFPGPFGAKLSGFWWSFHIGRSSHAMFRIQELHHKYGPYVRIGPNDLSILDPEGPNLLYGHGSKCRKAAWYDGDAPFTSIHTSRTRQLHDKRRRVWSPAFSDASLRDYEKRVEPYANALLQRIESFKGKPVNVAQWFNYFGYDVMGNLAFGKDFEMLSSGKEHLAIGLLNEGMQPLAIMPPVWLFRVLTTLPLVTANYWKFITYCNQQLDARIKNKPELSDVMTPLLQPWEQKQPKGLELIYLQADARLVIVAGSDTTSATAVYIFFHLAQNPHIVEKARQELKNLLREDGTLNHEAGSTVYVNGIINEALRMHPAVPTALQRITPPEGLQIGGTFVPGNTTVWCPQYAMGRSEVVYSKPNEFIPERWSTKPELIKHKHAFFPFSLGPMGCIGRPLAIMELKILLYKLLMAFDVSLAPGETGKDLIDKSRDHFTIETGPLNLIFKERAIK